MLYDKIILGAGLYGLYAARFCGRLGQRVLVLEYDSAPFSRATYSNQARVHNGYHYPRSYSTAVKSAGYFERFNRDYGFCVHTAFRKVYATSAHYSWTDGAQFEKFCAAAGIPCKREDPSLYFNPGMCDGAFATTEYAYDALSLKRYFVEEVAGLPGVTVVYDARIRGIARAGGEYQVELTGGAAFRTGFLLNATYASVNQIHALLGVEPFGIKYELCELILCAVGGTLRETGVTVMDGPFFSVMPFGMTGLHSLTSVAFTPHLTSCTPLPSFPCMQTRGADCSPRQLGNCGSCPTRPESAWPYMSSLARKFLRPELSLAYAGSLFSVKPILTASEVDDSRPTVVRQYSANPAFVSVLSGKVNTVYDLDGVLM